MYELIQVGENSFYIDCSTKIGVFRTGEREVCLIDSGNDRDAGKKVHQILEENGWTLQAIFNTHSHADHIGGNQYLQSRTGCKIYASDAEVGFIRNSVLETNVLFGGFSPEDLHIPFLVAEPSNAERLSPEVLPKGLETVSLPGHAYDMVGFRTQDDVLYLADAVVGIENLQKHRVSFLHDIKSTIETLEKVKEMKAKVFVPAHSPATDNIVPVAQYNLDKMREIIAKILEICQTPATAETVLQKIFDSLGRQMTFPQYAIVGSTLRSYLAYLQNEKKLEISVENNMLFWHTVS